MESLRRKDHALDPNVLPETVNTRRRWIETRAFTWQDSCSASFWQNGAESLEANTLRIYQSTIEASFYLFCMYMCTCVCRQRYGCIICRWVCRCLCVSFSLFVCIASEVDGRKLLFFQRLLPYSLDLRRSMCLMYVSEYMLLVRSSYLKVETDSGTNTFCSTLFIEFRNWDDCYQFILIFIWSLQLGWKALCRSLCFLVTLIVPFENYMVKIHNKWSLCFVFSLFTLFFIH